MVKTIARRLALKLCDSDIYWTEAGQGRPLVLLHGLADSHRSWGRVVDSLSRCRRVLMPDLLGHGFSGRPDAGYTLNWHSRAIHEWMAALDLNDVDLVGHSFGGGVAFTMLLECPERLRRLALVCPGGLGRSVSPLLRLFASVSFLERVGQPVMGQATRLIVRAFGLPYGPDEAAALSWMNARPGTAMALSRTVRDVIDWRGQRQSFWDEAHPALECPPVALLWGDKDRILPVEQGIALFQRVEGLQFTRFENCGHYPHREIPERFVKTLLAFLDSEETQPIRILPPQKRASSRFLLPFGFVDRVRIRWSAT